MRPGRFRPGRDASDRTSCCRAPACFNEARAFPPGKRLAKDGPSSTTMASFNEARAFPPGKSRRRQHQSAQHARRASMRPGRFRPGRGGARALLADVPRDDASMRPGRFRPGREALFDLSLYQGEFGFNEARAFPPGKSGWRRCSWSPRRGFNEARAFPPGKSCALWDAAPMSSALQ